MKNSLLTPIEDYRTGYGGFMNYLILFSGYDPFDGHQYQHEVVATQDTTDPDLLWFDDDYGQECCAYLSDHPEAIPEPECTSDIRYRTGDLMSASTDYIAHQVNCHGVMGAGLALAVRNATPGLYEIYQSHCRNYKPTDLLGKSFIFKNTISIFGQLNYGRDKSVVYTDYRALANAFRAIHKRLPIDKSIAFPHYMGCGLGNGDWTIVKFLIEYCFPGREIHIYKKGVR